jgi:uncharacterized protein (DUF305 family)
MILAVRAVTVLIVAALLVAVGAAAACRGTGTETGPPIAQPGDQRAAVGTEAAPPIVQPGAPGAPSRVITAERAADLSGVRHTDADVRFMQGMIHHHAQALDMTALVAERTAREDTKLLALRIELSQEDEIGMMQAWLEAVGAAVPSAHDHHQPGVPLMPGMLTAEEMGRLAAATGEDFDRLFLESMIRHHEGALIMVDDLFSTPGAGQESNIFAFASEVVADQRAEMDRMSAMLNAMRKERQP